MHWQEGELKKLCGQIILALGHMHSQSPMHFYKFKKQQCFSMAADFDDG